MANNKAYKPFYVYIVDGNRTYNIQVRRQTDNKFKFACWIEPESFEKGPPTFVIEPSPDLILEKGFTFDPTASRWRPSEGNPLDDRLFLETVGVHINDFLANNIEYQA